MAVTHDSITTIDELLALPEDGLRHELLDGEYVVTPAPTLPHQRLITALFRVLDPVLVRRDDAELLTSPADIVLGPKTLVHPDMFVVPKTPGILLKRWADVGVPLLAIEILSPSTASRDRGKKRRIYQKAGVAEYWIVDLDARLIERWKPEDQRPEIVDGLMRWELPGGAKGEFEVKIIFARIE